MSAPNHFRRIDQIKTCEECKNKKLDMSVRMMRCTKHNFTLPKEDMSYSLTLMRYTCDDCDPWTEEELQQ